ncbi:unnamed protein product [Enterobius vermicularis]|uniref:Transmembrane protein n=1 Tax=Enterobius vermicularis TaxID=51028 RepID=A0A0N4VJ20_ENTVE|nr:unnamed protein product [Enterobius vermicularis]
MTTGYGDYDIVLFVQLRETIAVPAVDDDDDEDDVAANAADFEFGMDRWMGSWINSEVDGWIGLWKYVGMIVDISVFYVYGGEGKERVKELVRIFRHKFLVGFDRMGLKNGSSLKVKE